MNSNWKEPVKPREDRGVQLCSRAALKLEHLTLWSCSWIYQRNAHREILVLKAPEADVPLAEKMCLPHSFIHKYLKSVMQLVSQHLASNFRFKLPSREEFRLWFKSSFSRVSWRNREKKLKWMTVECCLCVCVWVSLSPLCNGPGRQQSERAESWSPPAVGASLPLFWPAPLTGWPPAYSRRLRDKSPVNTQLLSLFTAAVKWCGPLTKFLHTHHHQLLFLLFILSCFCCELAGLKIRIYQGQRIQQMHLLTISTFPPTGTCLLFHTSNRSLRFSSSKPFSFCCRKS